jgi:hypothetical protein
LWLQPLENKRETLTAVEGQVQAVYRVRAERICEECGMQLDEAHWPFEVVAQSPHEDFFRFLGMGSSLFTGVGASMLGVRPRLLGEHRKRRLLYYSGDQND